MNKKYLYIILGVAVIGILFFFLTEENKNGATTKNFLIPEQSISHGHGLAVDVDDPNKVYIATHYGLLLLQNEKDLYRIGENRDDYMGFSVHPTDANVFFSSGHPSRGGNIGFQKSEDGGLTWQKISNGVNGPVDFHAMTISPVNPNIIYGWYHGGLQRSLDQGKTWEIINSNLLPVYLAADSEDENVLYAATLQGQGVMVSRDKGTSWSSLSPELEGGAVSVIAVHPQDSKILFTFSEKLEGLGKSVDAGKTWEKINESFNNETILHIAFSRNNPDIAYTLTHENKLFRSNDAGNTWVQIR